MGGPGGRPRGPRRRRHRRAPRAPRPTGAPTPSRTSCSATTTTPRRGCAGGTRAPGSCSRMPSALTARGVGPLPRRAATTSCSTSSAFLAARGAAVSFVGDLLSATASRPAQLGCFGLHEWAMVHGIPADDVRHAGWPLRLGSEGTDAVVERHGIRCSHFDAYRFFTDSARPRNALRPTRDSQVAMEQPGCLHAGMDVYKWAFKLTPLVPSDLVADAFELAREIRVLDMEASPYDLRELGYTPVPIETPEGKAAVPRAPAGLRRALEHVAPQADRRSACGRRDRRGAARLRTRRRPPTATPRWWAWHLAPPTSADGRPTAAARRRWTASSASAPRSWRTAGRGPTRVGRAGRPRGQRVLRAHHLPQGRLTPRPGRPHDRARDGRVRTDRLVGPDP